MSLYAIGDLHLHYQSVLKAPGQLHDRVWKNHEEKFRKNCGKLVTNEDTIVRVLIPKEKVLISESNQIINDSFSGSLPKFVAAFFGNKKTLSDEDAEALMKLIK